MCPEGTEKIATIFLCLRLNHFEILADVFQAWEATIYAMFKPCVFFLQVHFLNLKIVLVLQKKKKTAVF